MFSLCSHSHFKSNEANMPDIASVRPQIDRACKLVDGQRREIIALQRAAIGTADAELVLSRQLARINDLIGQRNRLQPTAPRTASKVLGGRL
jgi:hypothetical protein